MCCCALLQKKLSSPSQQLPALHKRGGQDGRLPPCRWLGVGVREKPPHTATRPAHSKRDAWLSRGAKPNSLFSRFFLEISLLRVKNSIRRLAARQGGILTNSGPLACLRASSVQVHFDHLPHSTSAFPRQAANLQSQRRSVSIHSRQCNRQQRVCDLRAGSELGGMEGADLGFGRRTLGWQAWEGKLGLGGRDKISSRIPFGRGDQRTALLSLATHAQGVDRPHMDNKRGAGNEASSFNGAIGSMQADALCLQGCCSVVCHALGRLDRPVVGRRWLTLRLLDLTEPHALLSLCANHGSDVLQVADTPSISSSTVK